MNYQRLQSWALRAIGVVEMLAFFSVVMPRASMAEGQTMLGFPEMPTGPVFDSVMRQVSFSYGLHGIGMWFIGSDVVRYRPLVILSAIGYLLAAPVFFVIDLGNNMPWSWIAGMSGSCLLVGIVLTGLLLAERASKKTKLS
jgi:hypothetical protein